jgi:hypothetical protein
VAYYAASPLRGNSLVVASCRRIRTYSRLLGIYSMQVRVRTYLHPSAYYLLDPVM